MIDFLIGSLSVLVKRGHGIISHLEEKQDLPQPVKAHCARIADKTRGVIHSLNRRLSLLNSLKRGVENGNVSPAQAEPIFTALFQAYRDSKRDLDTFEEFFAGHINRFNEADVFLTSVAERIWQETGLPGISPVAVTNTSGYFCTMAPLGIVFCPPSTENHLLTLPDFYHESGHILPERTGQPLHGQRYRQALQDHTKSLHHQIRRVARPLNKKVIQEIAAHWEWRWAEEVACDTLAARLVGPAYGWCNLYLCLQSPNVYAISAEHPADAARTEHIFRVLRRCNWVEEVSQMETRWKQYLRTVKQSKPRHYEDFHPTDLFTAIAEDTIELTTNLFTYNAQPATLSLLLNEAWQHFVNDPIGYCAWEQQTISALRKQLVPQ